MAGGVGHTGSLTKTPVSAEEDAETVIQIPVGLPCLERGRRNKKSYMKWFEPGY